MHFVVTNLNDPIISYDNRTNFVDKMIINPSSDEVCEICGRRGCAESEITPAAIMKKISLQFTPDSMPWLYDAVKGDFNAVNKDLVLQSYDKGDPAMVEIINRAIKLTAVLINNLYFSTNPQKIVLHHYSMGGESNLERIKEVLTEIGGSLISNKIEVSIIEDKHRFLAGCALAIRELFFNRGGFDSNN
jgi:predicted NBD/HSP70 family sugar kinase